MGRLLKHLGFTRHLGEFRFKSWLNSHASDFLAEVGIEEGQSVLDFGCGSGAYAIPAARLVGEDGVVYALDVSGRALDRLESWAVREGLENVVRIDSPGEGGTPLEDRAVDAILLIDVLQEVDDREALFAEAHRVLRPGGIAIVFPMHLEEEDVIGPAVGAALALKGKKYDDRILLFEKAELDRIEEIPV